MGTVGNSPTPQWDNRNRGFIPPAQLQLLRQSSPLAREISSERPHSMVDSLPTLSSSSLRPSLTAATTHSRSSSFFSFLKLNDTSSATTLPRRTEPASQQSRPDEHGRNVLQRPNPLQSSSSSLRSNSLPVALERTSSAPNPPQSQPLQSPSQSQSPPSQPQQLHPEIRSVVKLTHAHTHKIYMSGPLVRRIQRLPDGHQPIKDEGWRDVWAQLGGTTLSIWDMKEIEEANKQGREVPPTYINVTDAFVHVLGAVTIPTTGSYPPQKYNNVVTLNTAGSNLILFSCPSSASLISWATALRLASWEKSRLEEIYTAHLIRITLNDGHDAPSTLVRGRREGWVRIRIAGQTDWKHLWMVVSSGTSQDASGSSAPPGTLYEPQRRKRISALFGREENQSLSISSIPLVAFYLSPKPKDKKKPFLTLQVITQAFAVYPERPELINKSTLMKIEGTIGNEDVATSMRGKEGWVLVMPELEAGVPQTKETIRWLIALHDAFSQYGRPRSYSWDPRDPSSMMFAYPIGPNRDMLFLERESAESMDPTIFRTSVVRSRLMNILSLRMQAPSSPSATSKPLNSNAPPSHLPSTNEPARGTSREGSPPLPQITPISLRSSEPSEATRRTLTPIIEGSGGLERDPSRAPISEESAPSLPQQTNSPAPAPNEDRGEEQVIEVPISTSPSQPSPPSVYAPTEATSVNILSPQGPSREVSRNASIAKPEAQISFAGNISSERRPSVDGNRASDVRVASPTSVHSLHNSVTPPPSLSPANSSNPPASVSPVQAPPRTPSPDFSILTSPHSPNHLTGHSFVELGSSGERSLLSLQSQTPPVALHEATLPPPKLSQDPMQTSKDMPSGEVQDISEEPGALYYIHQFDQGSLEAIPQPPPDSDNRESSYETDSEIPYHPQFIQPSVAPLRPKGASPPPPQPTSPRSLPHVNTSQLRKPPNQQIPRTPTLDYGPERRPAGARAPGSNHQVTYQAGVSHHRETSHSPHHLSIRSDRNIQPGNMSHLEDSAADALAALSFLDRHDGTLPDVPSSPPTSVTPPSRSRQLPPAIVEPEMRPSTPESENASLYKSSFAPSKNAMQRKARSEAQQAAHEAATHRPGRGSGRTKNRPKSSGAWADSSEEEEEEEEDEDEDDVDSDGQAVASREDRSVSNYAPSINHRSQPSPPRGPSPFAGSDAPSQVHPRQPRNLPPVPTFRGQNHDGDAFGPRHADQSEAGGGRSYYEDGVSHNGAIHRPIPTHAPAPIPPRHMWSQVLDPGRTPGAVPDNPNARDTFIQLDSPAHAMTKAFTPHGLLSAGLQDKEDRSAKRQEELARETGASLINVPSKPPPPQTGLLGAITAHERDRKREGGVGATLTEREREKRLAEERQRKLDELQRQQLEHMQQGGSMYGQQQFPGYNPMMNPMMMPMNPMMTGYMGYPNMMPGFGNPQFGNPQHMFAAQQAAQAYQQAMVSLSQAGSQVGADGGSPAPLTPMMTGGSMGGAAQAPLNPMMTGGGMSMGGFDPRFSMMSMPMMNPMAMGMGMGMGMGNPGMMGGATPMGGMGMPMNTGSGFDSRMSQFDPGLQPSNHNLAQPGRPASNLGQDSPGGVSDGARRSVNASPRPPQ